MQNAKHDLMQWQLLSARLYKIFPVIQYSVLKLQRSTDGRIPSLLAKQEERAILKGSFPALVLKKGTNIHTNHRTHVFKSQDTSPSLPTSTARNLLTVAL